MTQFRVKIDQSKCTGCGICLEKFGCPAFMRQKDGKIVIKRPLCNSNGSCINVCPENAIVRVPIKEDE